MNRSRPRSYTRLQKEFALYGYALRRHRKARGYHVDNARHFSRSWHDSICPIVTFRKLAEAEAWLAARPIDEKADWQSDPEVAKVITQILIRVTKFGVML